MPRSSRHERPGIIDNDGMADLFASDVFESLPLPGADVRLARAWLPPTEADAVFACLCSEIPWERHRIRIFGREVDSPRLSCWIGDADAVYRYSGTRFAPRPWLPPLRLLCDRLSRLLSVPFNSVLANRYRDGSDAMGWHADDEPELGAAPIIASLSLGAERLFAFKPQTSAGRSLRLRLPHGSLLVMAGATQSTYRHAVPRTRRAVGERLNLTFRRIIAADAGR